MSNDLIQGIKKLLEVRIPELDRLVISWFGGEPLLAKEVIYEISNHITQLKKYYSNLSYEANITTNAYLLDWKDYNNLCKGGVSLYQISLDGIYGEHDKTRVKANGKGSFEKIIRNLKEIRDKTTIKSEIVLRLHYTPDTLASLLNTISYLKSEFGLDNRFKLYIKAIEKLGSESDFFLRTYDERSQKKIKTTLEEALDLSGMVYSIDSSSRYICYASKANSFGIRANGQIVKCTVALEDDRNMVGTINPDGTIDIINEKITPWLTGLVSNDNATLACPYKHMGNKIKSTKGSEKITEVQVLNIIQSHDKKSQ